MYYTFGLFKRIARSLLERPLGAAAGGVLLLGLLAATPAAALPSFAQQTGQPCNACHVGAFGPQLKPYARDFKLFGYQSSDGLSHEPPIAAMMIGSFTHTQDAQQPAAAPDFAPNDNLAVDQVSVYYAGKAPGGWGVFAQDTYDGVGHQFNLDNVDIRKVKSLEFGDTDVAVGLDFNNNPTVQDAWNSTPAWGYPYNQSPLGATPAAAALIDGGLAHLVAGSGAYVYWNYKYYAEVTVYAPLDPVFAGRLGEGTNIQSDRFTGAIPYWRLALVNDIGKTRSVEVGTYGLSANRYPGGVAQAGTDRITDYAFDANFVDTGMPHKSTVSAHATWIHEDEFLGASAALLGTNRHDNLDTLRADVSYSFSDRWTPTVQVFHTRGSPDSALYAGPGGSPNSDGYVFEIAYAGWGRPGAPVLWANWRAALQYVGYSQFDGARRGASANNTVYLNLWMAVAPFGALVHR